MAKKRREHNRAGRPRKPRAIDLFSGCGGLTEGLRQACFKVVAAVECDALAVETYRQNHPSVLVVEKKIQDVTPSQLRRRLKLAKGELDLLAGCPPCQGFSSLTTLNGKLPKDDERNELVFQFVRFVREFMPRSIMMENVPGLAADERIVQLCSELHDLGYDPEVKVLNAADYAVPQRRRRMILLAGLKGKISFADPCPIRRTVADAFSILEKMDLTADPLHLLKEKRSAEIVKLISEIPKDGGSRCDLGEDRQLKCHQDCDGFKDVYGRMAWRQIAPTITGGCFNPSKGRFLHPEQNRAITMREAAVLQTFPPRYHFSVRRGKTAVAQMIGNALPPEFIRRHSMSVAAFLAGGAAADVD